MKRTTDKPSRKRELLHSRAGFITIETQPPGRTLLRNFIRSVKAGKAPEPWVLQDLATRLQQALDGITADTALGLLAGKGRKHTHEQQFRDQVIAAEVEYLYAQRGRGSLEYTISIVAMRHNLADSTVRNLYKADQRMRKSAVLQRDKKTKK